MKLMWLGYLVYSLGNCTMKLCIETGLRRRSIVTLTVRRVSTGVSSGCHVHLLERHVTKTALFA